MFDDLVFFKVPIDAFYKTIVSNYHNMKHLIKKYINAK